MAVLGLTGLDDQSRWEERVTDSLGEDVLRQWRALPCGSITEAALSMIMASRDSALLLPPPDHLLRDCKRLALQLAGSAASGRGMPLLEVGSGAGLTAAVLSAALETKVVAIDQAADSATRATEIADLLGADVEAHEAPACDLPRTLRGRTFAAGYTRGVLRYLQPYRHVESRFGEIGGILDALPRAIASPEVAAILAALGAADLFALEVAPPCWVCLLDAASVDHGFAVDQSSLYAQPIDGYTLIRLNSSSAHASPMSILRSMVRVRCPEIGVVAQGLEAELMRRDLEPVEVLCAFEVFDPAVGLPQRLEMAIGSGFASLYTAYAGGDHFPGGQARLTLDEPAVLSRRLLNMVNDLEAQGQSVTAVTASMVDW